MPASESPSGQSDDFFNTPVHQNGAANGDSSKNNEQMPRPKRIACTLCRKRKLKCDGTKPSCGTCSRLGHTCEYSEERKKSGPKRGYVKLLEARLKQVENLLETRETPDTNPQTANPDRIVIPPDQIPPIPDSMQIDPAFNDPAINAMPDFGFSSSDDFSWEMIGLGLEEALPTQDAIDELNQTYFEKIHPSMPMMHKGRFLASMDLAPHMRPAVCLRYAMWMHACSITTKFSAYTEHFYQRARKYAEQDEMRGHGEGMITLAHCQAWTLIGCYEFKMMYFPRAWMSIGRSCRLALMMGLHRQDRVGLDVKQTLPPPRDWTDREERRRTFWMSFCQDRYASIGTGWPMTFDEADILTNLPASEEAFLRCQPEPTSQLSEVLNGEGTETISAFSGVILLSTLYGRNLTHLHRPSDDDADHDLNGKFWKRHRQLDNILLNISLAMPQALRLPGAINDPNAIFCNMNVHTATICLHQAAIFKADKNQLPAQISAESKRRCIVAADQVTNIMKMISHIDLSLMNPFLAFCLYVSARVFVQYLKSRKDDSTVKSSLNFLLAAMQVLKAKNPLTESFLVQLDVDLEGSGLEVPSHSRYKFGKRPPVSNIGERLGFRSDCEQGEYPQNTDTVSCTPIFEIRQSQGGGEVQAGNYNSDSRGPHAEGMPFSVNPGGAQQRAPDNDCAKNQAMDHLQPAGGFSGDDLLYGQPTQAQRPSPGTVQSDSSNQSNQPTPTSSSNRQGSYSNFTPPQPTQNAFSPPKTEGQEFGLFGNNMGGNMFASSVHGVTDGSSWNFTAVHQNRSPAPQQGPSSTDGRSQEQQAPSPFNFGTGMTPGATGMTPLPDSLWASVNEGAGSEWMYNFGNSPQR